MKGGHRFQAVDETSPSINIGEFSKNFNFCFKGGISRKSREEVRLRRSGQQSPAKAECSPAPPEFRPDNRRSTILPKRSSKEGENQKTKQNRMDGVSSLLLPPAAAELARLLYRLKLSNSHLLSEPAKSGLFPSKTDGVRWLSFPYRN